MTAARVVALGACAAVWLAPAAGRADEGHALQIAAGPDAAEVHVAVGCPHPDRPCEKSPVVRNVPNLLGLRGSETAIEGRGPKAGVGLVSESMSYVREPKANTTLRVWHLVMFGGGRGGVEGALGAGLGIGLLGQLGRDHGLFFRGGGRAYMLGNSELWSSLIELPQLDVGYQLHRRSVHFELAAHGGPVLVGRYSPQGGRRPLGSSFEWGGLAAFRLGPVDFDLEWTRVEARDSDPGTPVDMLTSLVCGGEPFFGVCFDARLYAGDVRTSTGVREVKSAFLGISLGAFTR
jgi:hypothetical protein